jgi:hypothetical protein
MPTWGWICIIAAGAIIAASFFAVAIRANGRRAGERALRNRRKRHEQFDIRELSPVARERYESKLRDVQTRFVDDPSSAVREADRLVQQVLNERGYPVDDFEQRAADLSVDHPHVVAYYRSAHHVWEANERGEASTEDLRQALIHYRLLFDELLGTGAEEQALTRDTAPEREARETEARR